MKDCNEMIKRALEIKNLADSGYASDSHITELSEKFYAEFGHRWVEVI